MNHPSASLTSVSSSGGGVSEEGRKKGQQSSVYLTFFENGKCSIQAGLKNSPLRFVTDGASNMKAAIWNNFLTENLLDSVEEFELDDDGLKK
uniref:Uncharacterized protein n=1 Tax=Ditylenchus dipsaci TaxID=166011 RepID=A0A915EIG0_9BILA